MLRVDVDIEVEREPFFLDDGEANVLVGRHEVLPVEAEPFGQPSGEAQRVSIRAAGLARGNVVISIVD